jgi:uncharacterized protein (TIGR02246 family)
MRTVLLLAGFAMALSLIAQNPQVTVSSDLDHTPDMDSSYIRDIKLWKALQAGDDSTFKSNFSPDLVALVGDTQQNRDQFAAAFKHCKVGPLNLQNHNTKTLSPDSIATTYGLHLEMTCGKQAIAKNDTVTTTWNHVKGDKWLVGHITETPIPSAP